MTQPYPSQPQSGYLPAPVDPPTPELRRRGRTALIMGCLSLPLSLLSFGAPVVLLGSAALSIVALISGIRVTTAAHGKGMKTVGTAVSAIVVGSIGLLLAAVIGVVLAVFWSQFSGLRECLVGANTAIAQQSCQQTFLDEISGRRAG